MMASPLSFSRAAGAERMRDLALIGGLLVWLVYTRPYLLLEAAPLTAPPCPFFYVTGHPCPFCGGTRSFAYMWQGDLANSVRLYPLGPALFAGSSVGAPRRAAAARSGRN